MTRAEEKAILRNRYREKGLSISPAEKYRQGVCMAKHLQASPLYLSAQRILSFYGTGHEVDTLPLLEQILSDGKTLYLPRCLPKRQMTACLVRDLGELTPDAYQIPAPSANAPTLDPASLDLILVPCVCASRTGERLGQGGGYYDRYLPQTTAPAILLATEQMLLDTLPTEPQDISFSWILSERELYHVKRQNNLVLSPIYIS